MTERRRKGKELIENEFEMCKRMRKRDGERERDAQTKQ
jgi:hypothetical protein